MKEAFGWVVSIVSSKAEYGCNSAAQQKVGWGEGHE